MVSEIIVEDGKVTGVEIDKGFSVDKGIMSPGVERIKSPIVICAVPLWDLFKVVRESSLPYWYVAWVKRLCENFCQVWTLWAGLKEPLWEPADRNFTMPALNRTAPTHGAFFGSHVSVMDPSVAPKGEYLFIALLQADDLSFPALRKPQNAENRRRIMKVFENWEADITDLWPKFKKALWVVRHANALCISEMPGYTSGAHVPDVQPPGVEGLYS